MGRTSYRATCRSCRRTGGKAAPSTRPIGADRIAAEREAARVRAETKRQHEELLRLREQSGVFEAARARLQAAKPVRWVAAPAKGKRVGTLLVIASDWHVEEEVSPGKVANRNAYNLQIAEERARRFFAATQAMLNLHRNTHDVDNMIVGILGDMITNYLHPDNVETNLLSPPEAITFAHRLLTAGIKMLLDDPKTKRVIIPFADGNHGRMTEKMRAAARKENSLEQLLYHFIASEFANNPRVECVFSEGQQTYLEVYGKTIRFTHGDQVRYQGGVGGITIPLYKALKNWDTVRHADLTCMGHFHQLHFSRGLIVNGSLMGYSPYSLQIGAPYEPPQQACVLLDSEHFDSIKTPLWVASSKERYK